MTTHFYRFESEAHYLEVITVTRDDGESYLQHPQNADLIGVITKIVDGEPIALYGWHVNLPYEHATWADYKVEPVEPIRIFWSN